MPAKHPKKRSKARPRPEPAQLKAIERLLQSRDYAEAVRRIQPLVRQFPTHGGLRAALVAALEDGGAHFAAGLAAYQWVERQPNSLPAQETLLRLAIELRLVMLAERIAQRVRELGGDTPGFPLDTSLLEALSTSPDGTRVSVEALERLDIAQLHLGAEDFSGVLTWLEGLDLPVARNNRALALFHLDRIDEALEGFAANWDADPQNLFALGWMVRLRLYQGDVTGAHELCARLAAPTARRSEDAAHQVDALLLLRQDQQAWDAFERSTGEAWFGLGVDRTDMLLRHLGACAASRLGKGPEARHWWREAAALDLHFELAHVNLHLLGEAGKPLPFPAVTPTSQGLPITWTASLRTHVDSPDVALRALSAANAYLEALYVSGDATLRALVGIVLRNRARHADADAVRLLRALPRLPIGTAKERFDLLSFLQQQGLLAADEPVEFWDGTEIRRVELVGTDIHRDVMDNGLPPELAALLGEALTLYYDGQWDAAEAKLNTILEHAPDHPAVLGNLASVREAQGHREEARERLRQVVEKHPDYLFARCTLAGMLVEEGELDEADRLLQGLAERERMHIQEVFALYGAQAMLSTARGDDDTARSFIDTLESLVQDAGDAARLDDVKGLVAGVRRSRATTP